MSTIVIDFLDAHGTHQETRVHEPGPGPTQRKTVRFVQMENNCGGNVISNYHEFLTLSGQKELSVVCGSLGVGDSGDSVWWEWGGPDPEALTIETMLRCPVTKKGKNCHMWLEDEEGRVYDIVPNYIVTVVCQVHRKQLHLDDLIERCLIVGRTKSDLQGMGLWYHTAAPELGEQVVEHTLSRLQFGVVG